MSCRYHDAAAVCDRCPDEFDTDGKGFPHPAVRKGRQALRVCAYCDRATALEHWDVAQYHRCLDCARAPDHGQGKFSAVPRETVLDDGLPTTVEGELKRQGERARRGADRRRPCTVCLARGQRVDATHVAGTADGFEWFECGQHEPTDNVAEVTRAKLTPIAQWFHGHGLPVPGDE